MRQRGPSPVLWACRGEDPEAGPDAGRGDHRSPVVPALAVSRRALLPAPQEALHPELSEASLLEPEESLHPAGSQALAQRHLVQADARRQDAVVSHHARQARPEAHPVDAVARARPMAHRPAVLLRPKVRRLELAAEVLPGVQREELPVQVVVSERPSELLLVEQVAVAEVPWAQQPVAAEAQPWVQPEEEAAVELLSEVRVVEAELPSVERAAAEAQRAAVPAAEEERLVAERVAEAVQPSAGQAAVPVQLLEARAELPSAEPSVRSDRPARVRLVR